GSTRASAPLEPPGNVGSGAAPAPMPVAEQPIDLMTSGTVDTAGLPAGAWIVQIGAGPSEDSARSMLSDAAGKVGGLGDFRSYVERFEKNGQIFYRARFVGFGDRDGATAMCNRLKDANMACLAMQG
ncbi:MAG TPA: SPOR domain-containing protein, partial [Devosia sp.]|nr:SPOR domain-containing protein [Devosia sp.]